MATSSDVPKTPSAPALVLLLLGMAYGAMDEWHQAFVRGRSPDLADWFADVTGVVLGYTALLLLFGWLSRRSKPKEKEVDVSH